MVLTNDMKIATDVCSEVSAIAAAISKGGPGIVVLCGGSFLKKSPKSPKRGQNEPFWPFLPFRGPKFVLKLPFFARFQFAGSEKYMYTFFQNLSMGVFERRYVSVQKTPLSKKISSAPKNIPWRGNE